MIRILSLSGNPYNIGRQHGKQVADLRPHILTAMQARLAEFEQPGIDDSLDVRKVIQIWEKYAAGTLDILLGISESLDLDWKDFFTYTVASFISGYRKQTLPGNGCTTWAVNENFTRNKNPFLVKNRDSYPDYQPLQCLARVQPDQGYPYLCLTSAGSPGVNSSGINIHGLAVADTYIASSDIGLGIARYSLMMDILQNSSTVREAIDYLPTRPHFGDGSVTVLDAQGDMAVFEIAHSVQAVRQSADGFIAITNHYIAPETKSLNSHKDPFSLRGNSQERLARIEETLRLAKGQVDIPWSQALMGQHDKGLSAFCRHANVDPTTVTISCAILSPQQAGMHVSNGPPCRTPFEFVGFVG